MILHTEYEQNSSTWLQARVGKVTASEAKEFITPTFAARDGKGVETYLSRKLAEYWEDSPMPAFSGNYDTDAGHMLQKEALDGYTFETNREVWPVGFITTDDEQCGCSPDGAVMTGPGADHAFYYGIEVKCPSLPVHLKWVLDGNVPKDHIVQVHFSMWVTGANQWLFMSYYRKAPTLQITVGRDDAIQGKITKVVTAFLAKLDKAKARLIEINGGPPRRTQPKPGPVVVAEEHANADEYLDLIP